MSDPDRSPELAVLVGVPLVELDRVDDRLTELSVRLARIEAGR